MDLNIFRKHLAKIQKAQIAEEHNNHAGSKNDFSNRDLAKSERAPNVTNNEVAQVKAKLESMPGVYEIFVKKDLNTVRAQAYYDYDDSLPFVVQLNLNVSKDSQKYNAVYEYRLVKREQGTPEFLKKYRPSKSIMTDGGANVFIEDLKQLTPFPKAHLSAKASSWKSTFSKFSK